MSLHPLENSLLAAHPPVHPEQVEPHEAGHFILKDGRISGPLTNTGQGPDGRTMWRHETAAHGLLAAHGYVAGTGREARHEFMKRTGAMTLGTDHGAVIVSAQGHASEAQRDTVKALHAWHVEPHSHAWLTYTVENPHFDKGQGFSDDDAFGQGLPGFLRDSQKRLNKGMRLADFGLGQGAEPLVKGTPDSSYDAPHEAGYAYHTTHHDNLPAIAEGGRGFSPPSFRQEQAEWPRAMGGSGREGRVYMARLPKQAESFSEPGHVLLRIHQDGLKGHEIHQEIRGSDYFTRKKIAPKHIQVHDPQTGTWHPVQSHHELGKGVESEPRDAQGRWTRGRSGVGTPHVQSPKDIRCTNATLAAFGVPHEGKAMYGTSVTSALQRAGYTYRIVWRPHEEDPNARWTPKPTVRAFANAHPKGSYVVSTNGHSMALIDGKLTDTAGRGFDGRILQNAYKVWKKGEPEPVEAGLKIEKSIPTPQELRQARQDTHTAPTEGQKKAGNYRHGRLRLHGLKIALESPKGSVRRGTDDRGQSWSVRLARDYGYINGAGVCGTDGDAPDVIVGPHPESELVFVVDQHDPRSRAFDEHKCIVGCRNEAEARAAYLSNYAPGWQGLAGITPMTLPDFKAWLKGKKDKPAGLEKGVAPHKYASTQVGLPGDLGDEIHAWGKKWITDDHLGIDEMSKSLPLFAIVFKSGLHKGVMRQTWSERLLDEHPGSHWETVRGRHVLMLKDGTPLPQDRVRTAHAGEPSRDPAQAQRVLEAWQARRQAHPDTYPGMDTPALTDAHDKMRRVLNGPDAPSPEVSATIREMLGKMSAELDLRRDGERVQSEHSAALSESAAQERRAARAAARRTARKGPAPATTSTDTPEFRAWFGASKMVDADGRPHVFHHGTNADFDAFDLSRPSSNPSTFLQGAYFANVPSRAFGSRSMPVYLKVERPFVYDLTKSQFDSLGIQEALDAALRGMPDPLIDDLVAHGGIGRHEAERYVAGINRCDGIVLKGMNYVKHSVEVIIPSAEYGRRFSPRQIKSATANSGRFSPQTADIHKGVRLGLKPGDPHPTMLHLAPSAPEHIAAAKTRGIIVPPASWGLHVSADPEAKVQATWMDGKGKKQYGYHPRAVADASAHKFESVHDFARKLPALRRQVQTHLKKGDADPDRVKAAIVRLMDKTAIRVGGDEYARKHGTYGASSLEKRHVSLNKGKTVALHFPGKHGKAQSHEVHDAPLHAALAHFLSLPGERLFQQRTTAGGLSPVTETHVREYLRPRGITPKQFRTYHATKMAAEHLLAAGHSDDPKVRDKHVREAVQRVATHLGNTPAVARSSYINPAIIDAYHKGKLGEAFNG